MRGAGNAGGLERRYRRLLAWYPPAHRAEHADEMLGVLMAGAREGQARPGAGESVNLAAGAVRIRLRRAAASFSGPHWHDALAVVSVLAPVLLLVVSVEAAIPEFGLLFQLGVIHFALGETSFLAGSLAAVALVLLRWRRAAAVAAVATVAAQMLVFAVRVHTGWWSAGAPFTPVQLFLGVLTLAGLLCSGGPRRGLEVLGRRCTGLIIGGALAQAAANVLFWGPFLGPAHVVSRLTAFAFADVAVPIAVVVMALRSPAGRRLILLTAPAVSPFSVFFLFKVLLGPDYVAGPGNYLGPDSLMWVLYLMLTMLVAAVAVVSGALPLGLPTRPSGGGRSARGARPGGAQQAEDRQDRP